MINSITQIFSDDHIKAVCIGLYLAIEVLHFIKYYFHLEQRKHG